MHKARPRDPLKVCRIHRTDRVWAVAQEPAFQIISDATMDPEVEGGDLAAYRGKVTAEVHILS
jgi:hypothetical protein